MNQTMLIAAGIILVALLGAIGVQTVRLSNAKADTAAVRKDWADEKSKLQAELTEANQRERATENRRQDEERKATDEAAELRAKVSAANDAAASVGRRLRDAQSAAVAGLRTCQSDATATASTSADASERVLADVQRRLDEATDRIARFADESRVAGLTCERIHDSLTNH
jgi:hypothetical protein